MEKDYLDELIEANIARDPRFATEGPSVEAALSLAALGQKAGLTRTPRVLRVGDKSDARRVSHSRVVYVVGEHKPASGNWTTFEP